MVSPLDRADVAADRGRVLAAYDDGVAAVDTATSHIADWTSATPCSDWRAEDLAGHLVAVVRYYHDLLDSAAAGRPRSGLPVRAELRAMNARELLALPDSNGPDRIATFLRLAAAYRVRLGRAEWDAFLGEWAGVGTLTVGEHTALAAGEWHIHAWDLALSTGRDHRPADAWMVAAARTVLAEPLPQGDPWLATLESAGRRPSPT